MMRIWIGYGPKRFGRVVRFQETLKEMEHAPALAGAALASETGYFDQAHLTLDMTRLAGDTPGHVASRQFRAHTARTVTSGTFQYRGSGSNGREMMTPGSILLGSPGQAFACGHEHSNGDRCLFVPLRAGVLRDDGRRHPGLRSAACLPIAPAAADRPAVAGRCGWLRRARCGK